MIIIISVDLDLKRDAAQILSTKQRGLPKRQKGYSFIREYDFHSYYYCLNLNEKVRYDILQRLRIVNNATRHAGIVKCKIIKHN